MKGARSYNSMIIVIGGGPAGRFGAMRLAQAGKEVLLLERKKIGGQCLHHGCMMVCALNDAARWIQQGEQLENLGIVSNIPEISFPNLLKEMKEIQGLIESVLDEETRQTGVDIRYGSEGRYEKEALYVDGERVSAEGGVIATGSRPILPGIPGVDHHGVITPYAIGNMKELPEDLTIIGGGVIAAELAYIFHTFGSRVTILTRRTFLHTLDPFLAKRARKELNDVTILENTSVCEIRRSGKVLSVVGKDNQIVNECSTILLAIGLQPNAECATGLDKGELGEILVDDHLRTSAPGIYACGDVTGPPYLTPIARMEGMVAADNILGRDRTMDYRAIPQSIALSQDFLFCGDPGGKVASVDAPSPVGPGSFWAVPSGLTGVARLLIDPENGQMKGVRLTAPGASLIGSYLSMLIREGFSVSELEDALEVHPNTDGILPLIRYMGEWSKKGRK